MLTTDHHRTGVFSRLFAGWLERANYDWGCGPIDAAGVLPGYETLEGHIARRAEFRSPRRPIRHRAYGR